MAFVGLGQGASAPSLILPFIVVGAMLETKLASLARIYKTRGFVNPTTYSGSYASTSVNQRRSVNSCPCGCGPEQWTSSPPESTVCVADYKRRFGAKSFRLPVLVYAMFTRLLTLSGCPPHAVERATAANRDVSVFMKLCLYVQRVLQNCVSIV